MDVIFLLCERLKNENKSENNQRAVHYLGTPGGFAWQSACETFILCNCCLFVFSVLTKYFEKWNLKELLLGLSHVHAV